MPAASPTSCCVTGQMRSSSTTQLRRLHRSRRNLLHCRHRHWNPDLRRTPRAWLIRVQPWFLPSHRRLESMPLHAMPHRGTRPVTVSLLACRQRRLPFPLTRARQARLKKAATAAMSWLKRVRRHHPRRSATVRLPVRARPSILEIRARPIPPLPTELHRPTARAEEVKAPPPQQSSAPEMCSQQPHGTRKSHQPQSARRQQPWKHVYRDDQRIDQPVGKHEAPQPSA